MRFRNCYEPYAFVCVKINNEELLFYFWIGLVVARSTGNLHSNNNKRMCSVQATLVVHLRWLGSRPLYLRLFVVHHRHVRSDVRLQHEHRMDGQLPVNHCPTRRSLATVQDRCRRLRSSVGLSPAGPAHIRRQPAYSHR